VNAGQEGTRMCPAYLEETIIEIQGIKDEK
jgi:hypothetical protein